MRAKRTAVIEDMEAFTRWLSTAPFVVWATNPKKIPDPKAGEGKSPGPDADLLAALKSMA